MESSFGGGSGSSGAGGCGGALVADGVATWKRRVQQCHTVTPYSLQRGHFHFDVSGADGRTSADVEGPSVAAVDWEGLWCGQMLEERASAHQLHLSKEAAILGYKPYILTLITPRLLIFHPSKLTGWKSRKETNAEGMWWWVRKAPGDSKSVDVRAVLMEVTRGVDARKLFVHDGSTRTG